MILQTQTLEKLCLAYKLGTPLSKPTALKGGLIHKLWKIHTSKGHYVVKRLNPDRIKKPGSLKRYEQSETISRSFQEKQLPAVTAILHQGSACFTINHETFMLFPYVNGKSLAPHNIQLAHIQTISQRLAELHQAQLTLANPPPAEYYDIALSDWDVLQPHLQRKHLGLATQLMNTFPMIEQITQKNLEATQALDKTLLLSHRDFDSKNVLWTQDNRAYLIDWESAGLINRTKDVISTAIYWSITAKHQIILPYFTQFLKIYSSHAPSPQYDEDEIELSIYSLLGDWLMWLKFNLDRVIFSSENKSEYALGIKEAKKTLQAIPKVVKQLDHLTGCRLG